ncbi:MAG: DUF4136 domain-containing protein [Cyclobacteriaceae bacterium]
MKRIITLFLIISVGCSSVRIKDVNKEEGFSLSNYKTFGFFQVDASGDAIGPNYTGNLDLLKKAITNELEAKGLTSAVENPDLMVNIGIVISKEVQTRETSFTNPGDRMAYMGQRNYSWHAQEVVVGTYKQGSVSVHLVDRAAGKLVWQATAESVVPEKEKNVPPLIEEGMKSLFAKLK